MWLAIREEGSCWSRQTRTGSAKSEIARDVMRGFDSSRANVQLHYEECSIVWWGSRAALVVFLSFITIVIIIYCAVSLF